MARRPSRLILGIGIPVFFPCLQRNTAGGKKLVNGAEEIALGMELVHDLKGGLHRLGENIVHQNDAAVPGLPDDLLHLPAGCPIIRMT